jgi:tagatose 6-phosphate kinase
MILAVCLNPALQRTLQFEGLTINRVNRAESVFLSCGGKGVNAARVAVRLNADVRLLTILGGARGLELKRILKEEGIPFHSVPVRGITRICSTLLDPANGTQTELVEESGPVFKDEVRRVEQAFEKLIPRAQIVILSGTAPKGFPETVYGRWVAKAKRFGVPSILDAPSKLAENGLKAGPWLFKPNWKEMEALAGEWIRSDEEAKTAMAALHRKGAENVLVTQDGPRALALMEGRFYRIVSPDLTVINPIGSGDAIAAGIAAAFMRKESVLEALRLGIACGSANVLTVPAGTVRPKDVRSLLPKIRIEEY